MSKYEGLTYRLARSGLSVIILTFKEIEALIGAALPASARRPQFWANANKPAQLFMVILAAIRFKQTVTPLQWAAS